MIKDATGANDSIVKNCPRCIHVTTCIFFNATGWPRQMLLAYIDGTAFPGVALAQNCRFWQPREA